MNSGKSYSLLWNFDVNKILMKYNTVGTKVVLFAVVLALLIESKLIFKISELIE